MDIITPQQPPTDPQPELPPVNTRQSMVMPPKKKKTGKILLIILLIVILLGGGAAAYWKFFKKPAKKNQNTANQAAQESKELTNHNFFQLGNKVISYDNEAKKAETLTDKVPADAVIVDLYANKDTWRLYYQTSGAEKSKIVFLEKDKEPETIFEDNYFFSDANAKNKIVAYTVIFSTDENAKPDEKMNHTYVYKDGKATEVFKSKNFDQDVDYKDAKKPTYVLAGISKDGKKLLMGLFSCFECDGPEKASAFELDIDAGTYEFVQQSEEAGRVRYSLDGNGFIITKDNSGGIGDPPETYDLSIFNLDKIGGTLTPIFSAKEKNWAYVTNDQKAVYPAVERRLQNFAETGNTAFDGLYYRAGKNVASLTKIELTGADTNTLIFTQIGEKSGSCSGVQLNTRDPEKTITNEVGVLCYSDTSHAIYTKVDSSSRSLNDTTQATFQVL